MPAAQNQHYVPRFILRNFLINESKEQVCVFDKQTSKSFTTSVDNIMAERRFNDFKFNDHIYTFEHTITRLEGLVLDTYKRVVKNRRLTGEAQEKVDLAFFLAFQHVRAKNSRQVLVDMENAIRRKVEGRGGFMTQIDGWKPLNEDLLKRLSAKTIQDGLPVYAQLLAEKTIFLMEPPPSAAFYLGDDPVCMHNDRNFGPYGNLGLAVPGIQVSMPLAANLLLCAWCPSVIADLSAETDRRMSAMRHTLFIQVLAGRMSMDKLRETLTKMDAGRAKLMCATQSGVPLKLTDINMQWYNSAQVANSNRYIVCKNGDFSLASKFNTNFPNRRRKVTID